MKVTGTTTLRDQPGANHWADALQALSELQRLKAEEKTTGEGAGATKKSKGGKNASDRAA